MALLALPPGNVQSCGIGKFYGWKIRKFAIITSMLIWQADFYRRPLRDASGQILWELLMSDRSSDFQYSALCPQSAANSHWLVSQFQLAHGGILPDLIQVFRPQSLGLIETASQKLGIKVEPTRHTQALKIYLQARAEEYPRMQEFTGEVYHPLALEQPPPVPLAEKLWGDRWRFATITADTITEVFAEYPIPILAIPESLLPINLGLASTVPLPGVVIDGGRQSMRLAQWLQEADPVALNYLPGVPDGLILEAGLIDRWVVATFTDQEVKTAGQAYENRKKISQGLHFLLVQPDDTGMTYSGFWLLRDS